MRIYIAGIQEKYSVEFLFKGDGDHLYGVSKQCCSFLYSDSLYYTNGQEMLDHGTYIRW